MHELTNLLRWGGVGGAPLNTGVSASKVAKIYILTNNYYLDIYK